MSILEQFDKCVDFYYKHINKNEMIDGARRITMQEISFVAYRESVANAICHRDYGKAADIKIGKIATRIRRIKSLIKITIKNRNLRSHH